MGFEISLASLVDQHASDYADLYLNSSGASSPLAQTYLNSSQFALPVNLSAVPQIFVVNPSTDNIFRHVNPQSAHAAIVALIYFSMWMGALGWAGTLSPPSTLTSASSRRHCGPAASPPSTRSPTFFRGT